MHCVRSLEIVGVLDWYFQTNQVLKTVDLEETERRHSCQSDTRSIKAEGFRFILAKTRLPVEKNQHESDAWQQRVKLRITVARHAK